MTALPSLLALLLATLSPAADPQDSKQPDPVVEAYHALADAGDLEGLAALWRKHAGRTLGTIDADLEGSLALVEKAEGAPDAEAAAQIERLHARARLGAAAADRAFDVAIFSDYAGAFTDWSREEQKRFRDGQRLFRESNRALRDGKVEDALVAAVGSLEKARPLGDWWGSAMALGAIGRAHAAAGRPAEALDAYQQARLLNQALRLQGQELATLGEMAPILLKLGKPSRAAAAARAGLALAEATGGGGRRGARAVAGLREVLKQAEAKD